MHNKSFCWVDAKGCPYISGLKSFKDISLKNCSKCVRFVENRELLYELLGEEFGGEWIDNQTLGIICSLLKILKDSNIELSHKDDLFIKEFLASR